MAAKDEREEGTLPGPGPDTGAKDDTEEMQRSLILSLPTSGVQKIQLLASQRRTGDFPRVQEPRAAECLRRTESLHPGAPRCLEGALKAHEHLLGLCDLSTVWLLLRTVGPGPGLGSGSPSFCQLLDGVLNCPPLSCAAA